MTLLAVCIEAKGEGRKKRENCTDDGTLLFSLFLQNFVFTCGFYTVTS